INVYIFNETEMSKFRAEATELVGTGSDRIQSGLSYNTRQTLGGVLNNLNNFRSIGYAGQFSYQYDSKYITEFSYRIDGSSNRGSAGLWSYSPSVGLRWNFVNEEFASNWDWLSTGNIRASWGRTTVPVGTIYDAYGRYVMDSGTYNSKPTVSTDLEFLPNVDLQPIVTTQWNTAVELGFWNERLSIIYENYYKQVDKDLVQMELANINAFQKLKTNEQ